MADQLEQLLQEHSKYFERAGDSKVKCLCNGHEFPARYEALAPFVKGNKFATLRKRYDAENNLEKYEPFIVQSKNFPHMLYCTLTGQLMDKSVAAVKVHMKGKKFQRNKELFAADKKELQPEPDVDTLMAEVMGRKASTSKSGEEEVSDGEGEGEDEEAADSEEEEGAGDEMEEGSDEEVEGEDVDMQPVTTTAKGRGAAVKKGDANSKQPAKVISTANGKLQAGDGAKGKALGAEKQLTGVKRNRKGGVSSKVVEETKQGGKQQQDKSRQKGKERNHQGEGKGEEEEEPEFWVPEEFAGLESAAGDDEDDVGVDPPEQSALQAAANGTHTVKAGVPGKQGKGVGKQAGKGKQAKGAGAKQGASGKQAAALAAKEPDDFEFSDVEEEAVQAVQAVQVTAGKSKQAANGVAGKQVPRTQHKRNANRPSKAKKSKTG